MFHSFITTDRKVYNSHRSELCFHSRVHSILSNDLGRSSFQPVQTDLGIGYSKIEKYYTFLRYLCTHFKYYFCKNFISFLNKVKCLFLLVQFSVARWCKGACSSQLRYRSETARGTQKRPPPMSLQLAVCCKPSTSAYCISVLSVN